VTYSVNNNNENNNYKYLNSGLSKYDTDNDGCLSVFELESIQDEEGIQLLYEDIEIQSDQENETNDINSQTENLETKLSEIQDKQGIISSAWNGLKCITGIGSSTKKCEKAIEDFKTGKITYEEAESIITQFETKQENSVNLAANIATGIAAVAVVGSAVVTGGLSLGVIAAAAGVGAATKAGLKFADRATNKLKGDALDGKQLAKDALSGAVDGAVSVATMGIGATAVTGKTVAEQTLKQTVIQGAKAGALDGAISGAVTGAADYTIDAALEEEVEFNAGDLIKTTLINTTAGAITGGVMGGIGSGIQYKKLEPSIEELSKQASRLNKEYTGHIDEAGKQIEEVFDGNSSIAEPVSARPKSEDSVLKKLINKFDKGKLTSTADDACFDAIGDGYGTRIQLKSISPEETKDIIEDCLYGYDISYEQFIKYINGDTSSIDDAGIATINEIKGTVIDLLKERQTQEAVNSLCDGIINGKITITELNNYGDDISSYFTQTQLEQISAAYQQVNPGQKLDIVTKLDNYNAGENANIDIDDSGITTVTTEKSVITDKGATKDSGYTSSQMNTKHTFNDGTKGLGELQIRGTEVNKFADVEHIPYDIRQGKITAADTKYSKIFDIIKNMSDDTYNTYNSYLKQVYNYLRLKELGIETSEPLLGNMLKGSGLSDDALKMLTKQGLEALSASHN